MWNSKYIRNALLGLCALALSGCVGAVADKVIGVVAQPILNLASKDAQTTLAWADAQLQNGTLTQAQVDMASACPNAILELEALRKQLVAAKTVTAMTGFKGLIYFGTVARFSSNTQDNVRLKLTAVISNCALVLPTDLLIKRLL